VGASDERRPFDLVNGFLRLWVIWRGSRFGEVSWLLGPRLAIGLACHESHFLRGSETMRRLALLVVCCCATQAWADAPLIYDGFDYPAGSSLAPVATGVQATDQGLQNVASGKYWFSAGTGLRPVVDSGDDFLPSTGLPAPAANSGHAVLSGMTGANGTATRIEIPKQTTGPRTVYWSGFLNVSQIGTLAGGPSPAASEAGVFIAGFNNLIGSQTGTLSTIGAALAMKRASNNPDSPRYNEYYLGTAPNSASSDCTQATGYVCANRRYADYLDPSAPDFDINDQPSTYKTTGADTRSQFPGVPLSLNQTYFVVGAQQIVAGTTNDVAQLWISPNPITFGTATAPAASVTVTSTGTGTDPSDVKSFFLRDVANAPDMLSFDELRVGLSWASVTAPTAVAPGVAGDYNGNGVVDMADYVLWRNGGPLLNEVNTPGTVDATDYDAWRARFGNTSGSGSGLGSGSAVPEPSIMSLFALSSILMSFGRRRSA
jgi:hypothetical protein